MDGHSLIPYTSSATPGVSVVNSSAPDVTNNSVVKHMLPVLSQDKTNNVGTGAVEKPKTGTQGTLVNKPAPAVEGNKLTMSTSVVNAPTASIEALLTTNKPRQVSSAVHTLPLCLPGIVGATRGVSVANSPSPTVARKPPIANREPSLNETPDITPIRAVHALPPCAPHKSYTSYQPNILARITQFWNGMVNTRNTRPIPLATELPIAPASNSTPQPLRDPIAGFDFNRNQPDSLTTINVLESLSTLTSKDVQASLTSTRSQLSEALPVTAAAKEGANDCPAVDYKFEELSDNKDTMDNRQFIGRIATSGTATPISGGDLKDIAITSDPARLLHKNQKKLLENVSIDLIAQEAPSIGSIIDAKSSIKEEKRSVNPRNVKKSSPVGKKYVTTSPRDEPSIWKSRSKEPSGPKWESSKPVSPARNVTLRAKEKKHDIWKRLTESSEGSNIQNLSSDRVVEIVESGAPSIFNDDETFVADVVNCGVNPAVKTRENRKVPDLLPLVNKYKIKNTGKESESAGQLAKTVGLPHTTISASHSQTTDPEDFSITPMQESKQGPHVNRNNIKSIYKSEKVSSDLINSKRSKSIPKKLTLLHPYESNETIAHDMNKDAELKHMGLLATSNILNDPKLKVLVSSEEQSLEPKLGSLRLEPDKHASNFKQGEMLKHAYAQNNAVASVSLSEMTEDFGTTHSNSVVMISQLPVSKTAQALQGSEKSESVSKKVEHLKLLTSSDVLTDPKMKVLSGFEQQSLQPKLGPPRLEPDRHGNKFMQGELLNNAHAQNDAVKCVCCPASVRLSEVMEHYLTMHPKSVLLISPLPESESAQAIQESEKQVAPEAASKKPAAPGTKAKRVQRKPRKNASYADEMIRNQQEKAQENLIIGPFEVKWMANGSPVFHCHIDNCRYCGVVWMILGAHVYFEHRLTQWDGFCEACRSYPIGMPTTPLTVMAALQHMHSHFQGKFEGFGLPNLNNSFDQQVLEPTPPLTATAAQHNVSHPQVKSEVLMQPNRNNSFDQQVLEPQAEGKKPCIRLRPTKELFHQAVPGLMRHDVIPQWHSPVTISQSGWEQEVESNPAEPPLLAANTGLGSLSRSSTTDNVTIDRKGVQEERTAFAGSNKGPSASCIFQRPVRSTRKNKVTLSKSGDIDVSSVVNSNSRASRSHVLQRTEGPVITMPTRQGEHPQRTYMGNLVTVGKTWDTSVSGVLANAEFTYSNAVDQPGVAPWQVFKGHYPEFASPSSVAVDQPGVAPWQVFKGHYPEFASPSSVAVDQTGVAPWQGIKGHYPEFASPSSVAVDQPGVAPWQVFKGHYPEFASPSSVAVDQTGVAVPQMFKAHYPKLASSSVAVDQPTQVVNQRTLNVVTRGKRAVDDNRAALRPPIMPWKMRKAQGGVRDGAVEMLVDKQVPTTIDRRNGVGWPEPKFSSPHLNPIASLKKPLQIQQSKQGFRQAYKCCLCPSYLCLTVRDMTSHLMRQHSINARFKCGECYYPSNTTELQTHFQRHHDSRPSNYHTLYMVVNIPSSLVQSPQANDSAAP